MPFMIAMAVVSIAMAAKSASDTRSAVRKQQSSRVAAQRLAQERRTISNRIQVSKARRDARVKAGIIANRAAALGALNSSAAQGALKSVAAGFTGFTEQVGEFEALSRRGDVITGQNIKSDAEAQLDAATNEFLGSSIKSISSLSSLAGSKSNG